MMVPMYACLERSRLKKIMLSREICRPGIMNKFAGRQVQVAALIKYFRHLMNVCPYLIEPIVAVKAGLFPGTSFLPWWRKREERECRGKY